MYYRPPKAEKKLVVITEEEEHDKILRLIYLLSKELWIILYICLLNEILHDLGIFLFHYYVLHIIFV